MNLTIITLSLALILIGGLTLKLLGGIFATARESTNFQFRIYFRILQIKLVAMLVAAGLMAGAFFFVYSKVDLPDFSTPALFTSNKHVATTQQASTSSTEQTADATVFMENNLVEKNGRLYKMVSADELVSNGKFSKITRQGVEYYLVPKAR